MEVPRSPSTISRLATATLAVALLAVLLTVVRASSASSSESVRPVTPPTIGYASTPTDEARALVGWAISRFVDAGLQLPDLEVTFPASCGGKGGRYFIGQQRIELCTPTRTLVLHELAHAWDDADPIDREAFMELRGLDHWYEHECDGASKLSGGEQLAIIMAWGLHEVDVSARQIIDPALPIEQQSRYLPGLDDSDTETLRHAFRFATGVEPLVPTP